MVSNGFIIINIYNNLIFSFVSQGFGYDRYAQIEIVFQLYEQWSTSHSSSSIGRCCHYHKQTKVRWKGNDYKSAGGQRDVWSGLNLVWVASRSRIPRRVFTCTFGYNNRKDKESELCLPYCMYLGVDEEIALTNRARNISYCPFLFGTHRVTLCYRRHTLVNNQ